MKTINIAALKANLSKVLKQVQAGERYIVLDRSVSVAEISAAAPASNDPFGRLAREGRIRLGKQEWQEIQISRLPRRVPIQDLLRSVREDGR